jgi:acyl carrier protein
MNNIEKYHNAFCETFEVEPDDLSSLEYQSIQAWDSVGHMALMAALEDAFQIEMEIDDIIGFSSYVVGKDVLEKYGVDFGGCI